MEPDNLCPVLNTVIGTEDKLIEAKFEHIKEENKEISEYLEQLDEEIQAIDLNHQYRFKLERVIHLCEAKSQNGPPTEDALAIERNMKEMISNLGWLISQRGAQIQELLSQIKIKSTLAIQSFTTLQEKHLEMIKKWRIQHRHYEGDKESEILHEGLLDDIQRSCETLAELYLKFRLNLKLSEKIVNNLEKYVDKNMFSHEIQTVNNMFGNLVMASFIVVKQPVRVCKQHQRIAESVTLRLLVGGGVNFTSTSIQVNASVIDEEHYKSLLRNPDFKLPRTPGQQMLKQVRDLKYTDKEGTRTPRWSAEFKNINIPIRLLRKDLNIDVVDITYWFCFETNFIVSELEFSIWALSHPIVVVDHGNQVPRAWATIIWDNCVTNGDVYVVPPFTNSSVVPWTMVAIELNKKWRAVTGCDLTQAQLKSLSTKLSGMDYPEFVTKDQFCKETFPEARHTFCEWFHFILKLVQIDKSLVTLVKAGLIHGFMSREQAETMLTNLPNDGYVIRFSYSNLGSIILSVVTSDKNIYRTLFASSELRLNSFLNRIRNFTLPPVLIKVLREWETSRSTEVGNVTGYVQTSHDVIARSATKPSPAYQTDYTKHFNFDRSCANDPCDDELTNWLEEIIELWEQNETATNNEISRSIESTVFTDMDKSTADIRANEVEPAMTLLSLARKSNSQKRPSSSKVMETNQSTNNKDLECQNQAISSLLSIGSKTIIKKLRWQKPDGFILNKRNRDKSKYKQRKALEQRAKQLTETCGSRVFLMVEDKVLCDSLDGGSDVAHIPESVLSQFEGRPPVVIPDAVVARLKSIPICTSGDLCTDRRKLRHSTKSNVRLHRP